MLQNPAVRMICIYLAASLFLQLSKLTECVEVRSLSFTPMTISTIDKNGGPNSTSKDGCGLALHGRAVA